MSGFNPVEVGVFGKPHGVKGEIVGILDVDGLDINADDFVFTVLDGLYVPFRVTGVRSKGASYLLTLRGIDSDAKAEALAGHPLMMEVDLDEPEDGEGFYMDDMIGYSLVDEDGAAIGVIEDYDDSTADNPLFVVKAADGAEILVPAAGELITDIDTEGRVLTMNLPEGLVNL